MLMMLVPSTRRCKKCKSPSTAKSFNLIVNSNNQPNCCQQTDIRRMHAHSICIFTFICSMSEGNEFYTEWTESYDSFDQMNLHENLLRGIYAYGT